MNYTGMLIEKKNGSPFSNGEKVVRVVREVTTTTNIKLYISKHRYVYKTSIILAGIKPKSKPRIMRWQEALI